MKLLKNSIENILKATPMTAFLAFLVNIRMYLSSRGWHAQSILIYPIMRIHKDQGTSNPS